MHEVVAIIPARWASTRLPGKALADIAGKLLVQHVYERACAAESVDRAVVATDDERIAEAVRTFGGESVMTRPDHPSGTDRVAEAARITGGDIIVNLQGDEPFIEPAVIDGVVNRLMEDAVIVCATAAVPTDDPEEYRDPAAVKVVLDRVGHALYFSRAPLPFYRDGGFRGALIHTGIYCFRRTFLEIYSRLEPTPLEVAEKLEQLRMLEHGYKIGVVISDHRGFGIDTPEDLERARKLLG